MEAVINDNPAREAALRVREICNEADGRVSVGLAGGSTPAAMYEVLRDLELNWSQIDLWLSDERWVAWDDPRSNGLMAQDTLTNHVAASLHRPPWTESLHPDDSAKAYEAELGTLFSSGRPDVVLLGMGADGHTASLFPGSKALDERERLYVSNVIPETGESRLTATYPLLWAARHILVLALGSAKAEAVEQSFAGLTPAGKVGEGDAVVEWHLDRDAASRLS